ncbi:hypothetical protein THRCLA_22828 [Thraustotheca clavata]|uniref:Uncharacterized protein n=1 Tax=Thraustotheca clavata TaxID=74557 RepID=A0A1V9YS34_9STRA|nr:hypothetical protein THRCLA_22828 [Thraustotheca clavata]
METSAINDIIVHEVSPTLATYFEPYSYLVIDILWSTDGCLEGKASSGTTNTTTVWGYKYDTCSVDLRSI